ncbi:hypothetical protein Tco_1016668 [Tanacetum coccineum]|uniref:Uncharacterized protein n=1 Tax=Tanacetum coccineum TaxID=301880 RepID=A0ABQ5FPC2_9ASTR
MLKINIRLPPKKRFSLFTSLVARLEVTRPYVTSPLSSTPSFILTGADLRVMVPLSNLIMSLAIVMNGVPKMKALMVVESEVLNDFPRFISILIAEFAVGGAVNLALKIKILHDVVGTSGCRCEVLRSFPVERIEQGNE